MRKQTSVRRWLDSRFVCAVSLLVVFVPWIGAQVNPAQLKTASSGERTASAVGFNCTTDLCSDTSTGCASCIRLIVELPPNAWVAKTHCYTTAGYPDDNARHNLHEVACGTDTSWSIFDSTVVVATSQHVLVTTTYHNRSHNRSRDIRLDVDWQPFESVQSNLVLPPQNGQQPAGGVSPQIPRDLSDDVLWSIAHEGCDVFAGDEMRPLPELQKCYASTQATQDASSRVQAMSLDTVRTATLAAIDRSRNEYNIEEDFDWVLDHEGQRKRFVGLARRKHFSEIRSLYKGFQNHNDKARNALSAISDSQIDDLIHGQGLSGKEGPNERLPREQSIALTDQIGRAILYGGCSAFAGESILPAEQLRSCFAQYQKDNHNGEAWDLLTRVAPEVITRDTERAVVQVRNQYPVNQLLNHFLTASAKLDEFTNLVKANDFGKARKIYASRQKRSADDPPYLLNALADSEIASIVSEYRLAVEIPVDTSVDDLESIAKLLETQKVILTSQTTEAALANLACGGALSVGKSLVPTPASDSCKALVRRVAAKQGLTITTQGRVVGGEAIELPVFPRPGVPTVVAFRAEIAPHVTESTLTNSGTKFTHPQPARLIQPEHGTSLSADTVKKYGDSGLQWYASAISADRIRQTDVSIMGSARVGIIDAGVDTEHPKLRPFFWRLPLALPDIPWQKGSIGYDYINEISDPSEDKTPDSDGEFESHGTHVAGLVTSRALASWLVTIENLKLEDHIKVYFLKIAEGSSGDIPDFTFPAQAVNDSLPNQIHIINLSLKGPRIPFIRNDITANSSNALLVLAAGNDQKDLNDQANWHLNGTFRNDDGTALRNVIIVAALMEDSTLTPDSNRGDRAVEIAAPGNNIYSTIQGGGFGPITGTSQAAPLVTSTAAILLAEHEAYPATIKERILATCDWDDALKAAHLVAEGCKLNMAKAIISKTDIIELVSQKKGDVGNWIRGTVNTDQFHVNDEQGRAIDSAEIQRIWFLDRDGSVRIAVKGGGGHQSTKLSQSRVVITLDPGEQCPTVSEPCQISTKEIQDIVFRWRGQ